MRMSALPCSLAVSFRRLRVAASIVAALLPATAVAAETVTIGGLAYINQGLVGMGRIPANLRDKFGETFGSGSGLAVDPSTWQRTANGYGGTFYMLPDRGYNLAGTFDYRARLNKLAVTFNPAGEGGATPGGAQPPNITATLTDTIALTD